MAVTDNPTIVAPVNRTDNVTFLPFNDVEALEDYFKKEGDQVSSVIVEGIQGVAGIRVATSEFLRAIRSVCDKYGAVYIADSIQCGCGRSGKYYSHDWAGVDADIYTMAKGIGNGFPIGAISIAPHIAPKYGMLGTTFGGNQLACAAATAVAEVMQRDSLMDNAAEVGSYIIERLSGIEGIMDIRGRGLMIGIEFPFDCSELKKKLIYGEHIFTGAAGKTIIRLLPALTVTKADADIFLSALERLLAGN